MLASMPPRVRELYGLSYTRADAIAAAAAAAFIAPRAQSRPVR